MVRFKNRHLLVEFLTPSTHSPTFPSSTTTAYSHSFETLLEDSYDDPDELAPIPPLPFLVPHHDPSSPRLKLGDEGGSFIFRAIRSTIQEVFGDEGWGRVASSFKVIYHSPLTTLTILRVARQHYRVFWAGITLLTSINGQPVLPRVVAMSGTIKKLQNRAVGYHRLVTGQILVAAVERAGGNSLDCQVKTTADGWLGPVPSTKEEETRRLEAGWAKEMAELQALED